MARKMGVSRAKIKRVEAGNDVITDTFVARFFGVFIADEQIPDSSRADGIQRLSGL